MALLHQESRIPKLDNRRYVHLLNFMYTCAQNIHYVNPPAVLLRRYDAPILFVNFPNNESFRRSILYQGAMVWNALPVGERAMDSHLKFKNVQKQKMLNNI